MRIVGVVLLILGILGLAFGGFSYSREKADAKLGPLEVEIHETERVHIPTWAGVAAIVVGGVLIARGRRK